MEKLLNDGLCPEDVKKLDIQQLRRLSGEIREFLIENISRTGGHLASNLGVVELTVALHKVFSSPRDKIIFDVGHQAYVHKILTGRCSRFPTLRTRNGISGFPKRSESEHDILNTGHSSTSISAALGMCRARDLKQEDYDVIAIIGDGSLMSGMAFEALNDAASSGTNLTVILNDNGMSISKNVGAFSKYLTRLRTRKTYRIAKKEYENLLRRIPLLGRPIIAFTEKIKTILKYIFLDDVFFEELGFVYMGTVDGHNIQSLVDVLQNSREIKKPKLIHISTQKGRGYGFAELKPNMYHGVSPFMISTGKSSLEPEECYTDVAARTLLDIMSNDDRTVVISAAMIDSLKLIPIQNKFPKRLYDVGIAEQHAVTMAAGMALEGMKPFVAIYSTFLQRAYDQILHDIVINSLPVVFLIDRAGIVGEDGETHHGIYDMAYLSHMPNLVIAAPSCRSDLDGMIRLAALSRVPFAIRYPKEKVYDLPGSAPLISGRASRIREGRDITILTVGTLLEQALLAASELEDEDIHVEVIDVRFIKPLDKETIMDSVSKTGKVITVEDGVLNGGFASCVNSLLKNTDSEIINMGIENDNIITHATRKELLDSVKINLQNIKINAKILHQNRKEDKV